MAEGDREFELTFEVSGMNEAADLALSDDYDVLSGVDHLGCEFVTLAAPSDSVKNAARRAVSRLNELGVVVHRLREDLVTRKDIAERANVTPQAVGAWVRRERRAGDLAFPAAYHPVAGGIYLWGEVNHWLRASGQEYDDWEYPSRQDYVLVNADLHDWLGIRSTEAKLPVSVKHGFGLAIEKHLDELGVGAVLLDSNVGWWRVHTTPPPSEYRDRARESWSILLSTHSVHFGELSRELDPDHESDTPASSSEHEASL